MHSELAAMFRDFVRMLEITQRLFVDLAPPRALRLLNGCAVVRRVSQLRLDTTVPAHTDINDYNADVGLSMGYDSRSQPSTHLGAHEDAVDEPLWPVDDDGKLQGLSYRCARDTSSTTVAASVV